MYKTTLKYYPKTIREHTSIDDFIDSNGLREYYNFIISIKDKHEVISFDLRLDDENLCLVVDVLYPSETHRLNAVNELYESPAFSALDDVPTLVTDETI